MVREDAGRRDIRLRGEAGFGSLLAGGDAVVALALFVGLGPAHPLGFGDTCDRAGGLDQVESFLDFWFGLGGFGLGLGRDALTTGGLEFVQATLGFVRFAAEADGAAPKAELPCQRHVGGGGLAERFQGLEAEADDVGGEARPGGSWREPATLRRILSDCFPGARRIRLCAMCLTTARLAGA
jgi:hypothetical protein